MNYSEKKVETWDILSQDHLLNVKLFSDILPRKIDGKDGSGISLVDGKDGKAISLVNGKDGNAISLVDGKERNVKFG